MTLRTMFFTAVGEKLVKDSEGCKLKAYLCPAGKWTIGYGHTGPDVYKGLVITQARAEQLFVQDVESRSAVMMKYLGGVHTNSEQFSAMLSLMFNIGNENFRTSTVLRRHLRGDNAGAADAILMWNKITVDGVKVVSNGLVTRRSSEKALYLS